VDVTIIGGADGPTSVFLAGEVDTGWFNLTGLIFMVLLLAPNLFYAIKFRGAKNACTNKTFCVLEQVGRYMSMFLMIFNIGIAEFGFSGVGTWMGYFIGNAVLLLVYWVMWILYFRKQRLWVSMALAILPTGIFLLSGIMMRHILLIISAVIFGIGHCYVTYQNAKKQK